MCRRLGLWVGLPAAALLPAYWFSTPVASAHPGSTGRVGDVRGLDLALVTAFVVAAAVYLIDTRKLLRLALPPGRGRLRRARRGTLTLVTLVVATSVSGVAQWAEMATGPMTARRASSSLGVFVVAGPHVWHRQRILGARIVGRVPRSVSGAIR